ncbi:YjbH domain-containing protein [Polynucleobacter kasalickyi]|uniref:Capsule biosynthesis GfcC n=1 Tax=Polynucleobacter kasalickyi TaxID=1938817 RepID=A0A1W2CA09_9BURK|nr:YjbH domain-containing protein [Polynucleobacter kasalickyi]SMC81961.1 Capsule biosynthesis GfcC [Polynucleobacter kasalickyi]
MKKNLPTSKVRKALSLKIVQNQSSMNSNLIRSKSLATKLLALIPWCLSSFSILSPSLYAQSFDVKTADRMSVVIGKDNPSLLTKDGEKMNLQGLMWNTPSEISAQQQLKDELLNYLSNLQSIPSKNANNVTALDSRTKNTPSLKVSGIANLSTVIQSLPVTGRVLLPANDPRWLEIHPQQDPIISSKDSLKNPERKNTVTLIQGDGRVCVIPFKRSVYAVHYTKLCSNSSTKPDWAWVIQADGAIEKVSLSSWNAKTQNYPAAGSWIWVPTPHKGLDQLTQQLPWNTSGSSKSNGPGYEFAYYSEKFSADFAAFLATQGPSDQVGISEFVKADRTFVEDIVFDLKLDQSEKYQPKDSAVIASDWGSIGLLQTPTARMMPAGSALFGYSHTTPYSHYNFALQPFNWLETSFRYSNDGNVAYGPTNFSGAQSYVDKSIDLKVRVLQETVLLPDVAIGIRDLAGTGLFSGEYVVASKRYGDFDFSAGLAWGYLGNRGNFKNPFSVFGSSFSSRPATDVGSGGNFSFGTYFHGPTALIGGVQYQTPYPNLTLKLELDGNNYQREPFNSILEQRSPINFGAVYRWNNANLTVGVERGNTAMISISIFDNLSKLSVPKLMEAPAVPIAYRPISPPSNEFIIANIDPLQNEVDSVATIPAKQVSSNTALVNEKVMNEPNNQFISDSGGISKPGSPVVTMKNVPMDSSLDIAKSSEDIRSQSGWRLVQIEQRNRSWIVTLDEVNGVYLKERMNRVISVLHRDAPTSVTEFVVKYQQHQLPLIKQTYNRQAWMMKNISLLGPSKSKLAEAVVSEYPSELLESSKSSSSTASQLNPNNQEDNYLLKAPDARRLTGGIDIGYQQTIGGPNGYLFALSALGTADLQLWDGAWIRGVSSLRVLDNYDKFTYDAPSNLPRVRTYMREYLTSNRLTVPNLQATQVAKLGDSHYFSAYGGMLEMMYGGVGGEWLYRPLNSPLALGIDLNKVRQRDFDQRFNFLDYQVTTGHITGYWQTGWEDVLAKVSYGQYLAGDRGYTVDVSKAFSNGVKMGAYFTRTNVSAEQFGEGSFDKGIYVSIPFDAFFTKFSNDTATILWNPLIRDGGAKLNRLYPLYNSTWLTDHQILNFLQND